MPVFIDQVLPQTQFVTDEDLHCSVDGSMEAHAVLAMARALEAGTDPFAELTPANLASALLATRSLAHNEQLAMSRLRAALRLQAFAQSEWNEQATVLAGVTERVEEHEIDGRRVAVVDAAVASIALATTTSEADVRRRLAVARTLEQSLPETRIALAHGKVTIEQASAVARAADRVPADVREELESALLPLAEHANAHVLRAQSNALVQAIDPEGNERRRAQARRRRGVWLRDEEDGNTLLCARMATIDAHACLRTIDARSRTLHLQTEAGEHEPLTNGQRMARALADLVLSATAPTTAVATGQFSGEGTSDREAASPTAAPRSLRVDVAVTVDLHTLLGMRDEPLEVNGVAQADIDQLRDLLARAADVRFRRLILEPLSRTVMDVGEHIYRPSAGVAREVRIRDGCCQWPGGCQVPADRCDLDHMAAFDHGGSTSSGNLIALCRWHHLLKTFHGYEPARTADDVVQWRGPDGALLSGP